MMMIPTHTKSRSGPSSYTSRGGPRTLQNKIRFIRMHENIKGGKVVGTAHYGGGHYIKVFKGPFGGFFRYNNSGNTHNVPKNAIKFNQKYLNNSTKPAGKWWWSKTKSNTVGGAPVYKNNITGAKATGSGTPVNRAPNGQYTTNRRRNNML